MIRVTLLLLLALFPLNALALVTILFVGDSLTAGHGVGTEKSYPVLLEKRLLDEGEEVKVINGGVSGKTTAGGMALYQSFRDRKPDIVVLALGANDGLRGVSLMVTRRNLGAIIAQIKQDGRKVLLAGMRVPPNYGQKFSDQFAKIFPDLAEKYDIPLIPFLLEGVGGVKKYNQADGIHPNAEGQKIMMEVVYPWIKKMI